MSEEMKIKETYLSVVRARSLLLMEAPFYGTLLMNLKLVPAACGTAGTDMRAIYWDPGFVSRLSTDEVVFVMLHEVLHCVLLHPARSKGFIPALYNIAADIVVNSTILKFLNREQFQIDGESVMCLAPDGQPGYKFTTEEVYYMLCQKYQSLMDNAESLKKKLQEEGKEVDIHDVWERAQQDSMVCAEWGQYIQDAAGKSASMNEFPPSVRDVIDLSAYKTQIPWRRLLHEYIQDVLDQYDYHFHPADRRFLDSEFILPGFHETEREKLEKISFFIDASGSVDDEMFAAVFHELKSCIEQFQSISGTICFFDTKITGTYEFQTVKDLEYLHPKGRGGTDYGCIFRFLKQQKKEERPTVIVILTDGYAAFPREKEALGIPVLWCIVDNKTDAPWGKTIHMSMTSF